MVCYHHVSAFRAIHCPSPHVGLQGEGGGGGVVGDREQKGMVWEKGGEGWKLAGFGASIDVLSSHGVSGNKQADRLTTYLLTPIAPEEHRPSTTPRHRTLFWSALAIPDQLVTCCFSHRALWFQLYFSVLPPTVARPASLSLPPWAPGQGLVCSAGCWLPEGVSDPAPLPPQYLLGHWFLLCFSRVHS